MPNEAPAGVQPAPPPKVHMEAPATRDAFTLLCAFRIAAKKAGWTKEQHLAFINEATRNGYNHLVATINSHTDGCLG